MLVKPKHVAQHGFQGLVTKPTLFGAGEHNQAEFVSVLTRNQIAQQRRVQRQMIHNNQQQTGSGVGGGSANNSEAALVARMIEAFEKKPYVIQVDGRELIRIVRARINDGYSSVR
jgi:hypothetical protein